MIKKILVIAVSAAALSAGRVSAAEFLEDASFAVNDHSVTIEEIDPDRPAAVVSHGYNSLFLQPSGLPIDPPVHEAPVPGVNRAVGNPGSGLNNTIGQINGTVDALDKIVNLAEKIWGIIEKNQPVADISVNYANAVPFGTGHWGQLQGWSQPGCRSYRFKMTNLYGVDVVKVTYQLHYTYGGNLHGKGKFLTGVTIEPLSVETAWGYKVSLSAEVPDSTVVNVGTHEDPVAAMQVQLKWSVHTAVKDLRQKAIYYVQGDGTMQEIGMPFRNAKAETEARRTAELERLDGLKF